MQYLRIHIPMQLYRSIQIVLGFMLLMLTGALLLMLPAAQTGESEIHFMDALFTSVSAVSVTGMSMIDIQSDLSWIGQLIIICLVQTGALGIMTIAGILGITRGRRIGLQQRLMIQESFNMQTPSGMVALVQKIAWFTLCIEFLSGTVMAVNLYFTYGFKGIYLGYWEAVSSFCNSGFDLMGNSSSMTPFTEHLLVHASVLVTMVLGGMGFIVLDDLWKKRSWRRLTVHSKIVLTAGLFLTAAGTVLFYLLERQNPATLGGFDIQDQWMISFFQSVSARMAGFNMIPAEAMGKASMALNMGLMFIGAGPVSTAGGIKTTTFIILILFMWAKIRGREHIVLFHREIDDSVVLKAAFIFCFSIFLISSAFFLILVFDTGNHTVGTVLFETISAYSTVGFTTGAVAEWNNACKVILMMTMFIGRIGVLTLILAFAESHPSRIKFPKEKVIVG